MSRFAPLESRRDVWLNDLPFSHVDDLGNRWIVTDIDGWWDLPPMDMGEVDRAYSEDGSYYEPGRFSSRAIRLTGKIIPPTNKSNSANLARQEFNKRLMLVRKTGLLQVMESEELGGGKQSEVVVVARPLMQSDRLNGVIDFDVQFRAPDPRKYSVMLNTVEAFLLGTGTGTGRTYGLIYNRTYSGAQSQNTALVDNRGDYNTYGVIRLHGPVDDPGAHHLDSDRHIKFPGVRLGQGQYLDIDLREKTIISESGISLRDRMDDSSRWFKFDEGPNKVTLLGTSYLDYVPSVPDVKNLVQDPSFEGTVDGGEVTQVRGSHVPNSSGTAFQTPHVIRTSLFSDHQAQDPVNFSEGIAVPGEISGPIVRLVHQEQSQFPAPADGEYQFVQMELKPMTADTATASLTVADVSSGEVPLTQGEWNIVRVDSTVPTENYDIVLNVPGASDTSRVGIRNIMVISSADPIAGEYPFWEPVEGVDAEGVETGDLGGGQYVQTYYTPDFWEIIEQPDSKLRVVNTGDDEKDGTYLIPANTEPHVVSFGDATLGGSDITYGVLAEGVTEVRLYDSASGELLQTSPPSHVALNYVSETEIVPRVEATISVDAGGSPVNRKITGAMITYDGGTKIFTDTTPNEDGYMYEPVDEVTTAAELVNSFITYSIPGDHHAHAREVQTRSYDGARSLEIVYNILPEDVEETKTTPVSRPDVVVPPGKYHVRAKIMANQPTLVEVSVEGLSEEISQVISTNPGYWADVSFPFQTGGADSPYITVRPMSGGRNVELYVDSVGIMTDDVPYFDGDTPGPYVWSGARHGSASATIPVVGVPYPRMEIMFRNAWIG